MSMAGYAAVLVAALILAAFVAVVVGSQSEADSRSIAGWCLHILLVLFLCELARCAAAWPWPPRAVPGLLILYAILILSIGAGRLIAKRQWLAYRPPPATKKPAPDADPWEGEIP